MRLMRTGIWPAVVTALLIGGSRPGLESQQDLVSIQKPIQHEVSVTLKLIQVYVLDKKGRPAQGLTKDDFVVRDNGREVALTEFEKQVPPVTPSKPQPPVPSAGETVVATPPPSAMSRKFLLFFDFANNDANGVAKSKEAALHFLNTRLVPGDQVGLMSYSMFKGLAIHEYLTGDAKKIAEAVSDLSIKEIAGRVEDFEHEYWGKATMRNESPYAKSRFQLEAERKESKYQVQNFIERLSDLAKALRYVPGKKNIVLFSTGVVTSLIYYGQASQPVGGMVAMANKVDVGDFALRSVYEGMLKELAASDCSVFSFDTRGAATVAALFDADRQSYEDGQRNINSVERTTESQNVFKQDKTTGFYSLSRLSSTTGGKYFSNIEEYRKNLSEVADLTGSFYVLGYPIGEQRDGAFHDIKIELKRKGYEVHAPAGYFNPKPFAEYSDLEKQLHLFDLALSDKPLLQNPLAFTMTGLTYYADGGQRLRLLSKLPAAVMDRFAGRRVELISLAFDDEENVSAFDRIENDLTKYRGMDVFWASGAVLRPGDYKCRLVIRDLESGTGAVASCRVMVPDTKLAKLSIHSPLPLLPGSDTLYLTAQKVDSDDNEWRRYYPYDRSSYIPATKGITTGTTKCNFLVPLSYPGTEMPEIDLAAWLIDGKTGGRIPLTGAVISRTPNPMGDSILLEVFVQNIEKGSYYLYLHVTNAIDKEAAYTRVSVVFY